MEVIGSLYTEVSDAFQKGIKKDYARCIKAEKHDLGVVLMNDVKVVGSLESKFESTNRIYDVGVQSNIEYNAGWKSRAENS